MDRALRVVLCLAFFCCPQAPAQAAATARQLLGLANEALRRSDVKEYEALLRRAWEAPGSAEDRCDVSVALGNFLWRIQRDPAKAREILGIGRSLNARPARPLIELARLETFERNFGAARKAARGALADGSEPSDLLSARTAFAAAIAEEVLYQELDASSGGETTPERTASIREALELVDPPVRLEPGLSKISRLDLLMALLAGDGTAALRAWQSYYRLPPGGGPLPPPLAESAALFARILPSFTADSGADARQQLVRTLAASRLSPEAAILALRWRLPQSKDNLEVIRYARWIRSTKLMVDENYRLQAIGKANAHEFQNLFSSRLEEIWHTLPWPGKPAPFHVDGCTEELRSRFGALIRVVPRAVNFGHVVRQEDLPIDQYGRRATLRFIVLDSMVSNAYTTWLWDGLAGVGGWAYPASGNAPATIVEVRTDSSVAVWITVTDPAALSRTRESIQRLTVEDDERARKNPYSYLPGLSRRMAQRGRERLLERLEARGLVGSELRAAFIGEFEKVQQAAVIQAHEGRHALDRSEKPSGYSNEELEYRAKLSEVAFAPEPLLALGGIFDSNIGLKGDSHGMANERIMKGLVAWMQTHASEIASLDRSRPLLPQFDKLTNDQMRAAFRSMDPWASGG